jgi:hypothetical protein
MRERRSTESTCSASLHSSREIESTPAGTSTVACSVMWTVPSFSMENVTTIDVQRGASAA